MRNVRIGYGHRRIGLHVDRYYGDHRVALEQIEAKFLVHDFDVVLFVWILRQKHFDFPFDDLEIGIIRRCDAFDVGQLKKHVDDLGTLVIEGQPANLETERLGHPGFGRGSEPGEKQECRTEGDSSE